MNGQTTYHHANVIDFFTDDEQESDLAFFDFAFLSQFLYGLNLSSHTSLGITGSTSIDILFVLTVFDIRWDDIDMGVEQDMRVTSLTQVGEDVLTARSNGL